MSFDAWRCFLRRLVVLARIATLTARIIRESVYTAFFGWGSWQRQIRVGRLARELCGYASYGFAFPPSEDDST